MKKEQSEGMELLDWYARDAETTIEGFVRNMFLKSWKNPYALDRTSRQHRYGVYGTNLDSGSVWIARTFTDKKEAKQYVRTQNLQAKEYYTSELIPDKLVYLLFKVRST